MTNDTTEFYCDICNAPMKLIKKVGTKESGKSYRQRWFGCTVCDYQKKIYADGFRDEKIMPIYALSDVKKLYKQQESYGKQRS